MWRVRAWGGLLLALLTASGAGAAVPRAVPAMVGASGTDADGYPLRTVDKRAVLRMLRARQFDALDAFANIDPTLEPLLDAWAAAKPDSYMALAARGVHQEAVGWHRRGGRWACETPP